MKRRFTRRILPMLLAMCLLLGSTTAFAATVTPNGNPYGFAPYNGKYYTDYMTLEEEQLAARDLAIEAASEGFVMLKNEANVLPLKKGARVSLFGMHSIDLVHSTEGSAGGSPGANGVPESTLQMAMENAGFKVNPKLIDLYTKHQNLGTTANELPISYYSNAAISTYNGYADAAIIVFSRVGSEGADKKIGNVEGHSDPTDHELMLDDNEKALIKHVKEYYPNKPIIVLVNASNILQIPELNEPKASSEYGVDAIFWVGSTGNNAIEAIGQILAGEVNPSGHTVEVWERDFTKGPSYTNFGQQTQNVDENGQPMDAYFYHNGEKTIYANIEYREGIYIGYKYYETAADDMNAAEAGSGAKWYDEQVLYPFGYGLSYTTFEWEIAEAAETNAITDPWQIMTMQVKVTNTGKVAGKDVVQVYSNPPYTKGGIEKASANLVGFAKTKLLQPGESEVVTIQWVAQDLASFDWNDANKNGYIGYELEAGAYAFTARRNSHEVVLTETYNIAEGIKCTHDYTSGNEITALFVDEFTSVNDSLLNNMISRATGLKQPEPASVEDRTIDDEYLALIEAQYTYHSYMDQGYEPWFVNEDGIPSTWTQAAVRNEGDKAEISILDMTGVDFTLDVQDGAVVQGEDEGSKKWEAFMNQLTWEEVVSLVRNGGGVEAIDAIGVAGAGTNETPLQLAGGTLWACPPILAASFNVELAERVGVMMGNEALFKGCSYWQGGAMNIHRSPLSGRNVEYYSQDGVHNGIMAAAVTKGVTSKGVTCQIKHMMLNDQESYRDLNGGVFTWATEQVIREIYAKPFEYALKDGGSTGVMGSFNRIGNINSQLNLAVTDLVKREWNNRAIFETDAWQGTYCPLDLMVRQGNNQPLGSGSEIPVVDLEVGTWSVEDNCVLVSDGGDGVFASQTHYAAVRKSAQEILWNYSNGNGIKNGYADIETCVLVFDQNAQQSKAVSYEGIDYLSIALSEGSSLPEGLTMDELGVVSGYATELGEYAFAVDLKGVDGYITLSNIPAVIKVVDPIRVSTTELKVGQAADVLVNSEHYRYGIIAPEFTIPDVLGSDTYSVQPGDNTMVSGWGGTSDASLYAGAGKWNILNWYWVNEGDVFGSGMDARGMLAAADAQSTDSRYIEDAKVAAGEYYRAFVYEFVVSEEDQAKLAEYGLSMQNNTVTHTGKNGSYVRNESATISGTPTKAGEVEITILFHVPIVRSFSNGFFPNAGMQATPLCLELTRTVTLTIAE